MIGCQVGIGSHSSAELSISLSASSGNAGDDKRMDEVTGENASKHTD